MQCDQTIYSVVKKKKIGAGKGIRDVKYYSFLGGQNE